MTVPLKTQHLQIQTQLRAAVWPGGSNLVFNANSVLIARYIPEQTLTSMIVPIAQIMPGEIRCDPQYDEEPDLWVAQTVVRVIVNIPGDTVGQNPLLGANRRDTTKSEGAGILDLEQVVYTAIGRLNVADGANLAIQFRQKGGNGGVHVDNNRVWLYQDLIFESICTAN